MRNHLKLGTSGLFVAGGGEAGHFPGRAGLTQDENMKMMKATVPTEAVGRIIDAGQEAIMEILANKESASILAITERTVKFHVSNILSKLGLERRTELVRWQKPM